MATEYSDEMMMGEVEHPNDIVQDPISGEYVYRWQLAVLHGDPHRDTSENDIDSWHVRSDRPQRTDFFTYQVVANTAGQALSRRILTRDRLRTGVTVVNQSNVYGTSGALLLSHADNFGGLGMPAALFPGPWVIIPPGAARDIAGTDEIYAIGVVGVVYDVTVERFVREGYADISATAH